MAKQPKTLWQEFTKGIIKENPVLRLVLGTCATLAVKYRSQQCDRHGIGNHVCSCLLQCRDFPAAQGDSG